MADQAQVDQKHDKAPFDFSGSLGSDVGGFAHDLLMLAELQSRLFIAEAREFRQRSTLPSVLLLTGIVLGVSCFPIAMISLALSLAHLASFSMAAAFMVVLALGALTSLLLLIGSSLLVRKRMRFFRRSQEEFSRNYEWFRSAFTSNRMTRRNPINPSKEPNR
jgi:hypothetical protein